MVTWTYHVKLAGRINLPTQPFILTGSINRVPTCPVGVKAVTSVGWQITLCDLIDKWRPVVLRWISRRTMRSFTFTFTISPCYGRRHAVSMYRIRKRGKVSSLIMTSPEAAPYDRHCIIVHDGWSGQLRARTLHTWPCTCLSSVVRCIYYTRPRDSLTRCTNFSELFSSLLSAQQPPIS